MWVLVFVFILNSPAVTVIPGYYTTKEKCEEAAKAVTGGFLERTMGYCVHAPDDTGYE